MYNFDVDLMFLGRSYIQFNFNYVMQDFNIYDKYSYWYDTFQSNILS